MMFFNTFNLSASDLLIWGIVIHLIADWPLQTGWMVENKSKRGMRTPRPGNGITTPPRKYTPAPVWWHRHPAAYVHAGIHGFLLSLIFGWAAIPLAFAHLIIDTRVPVAWWSELMNQTKPLKHPATLLGYKSDKFGRLPAAEVSVDWPQQAMDIGMNVRLWVDQVFHIVCIAIAALLVQL